MISEVLDLQNEMEKLEDEIADRTTGKRRKELQKSIGKALKELHDLQKDQVSRARARKTGRMTLVSMHTKPVG